MAFTMALEGVVDAFASLTATGATIAAGAAACIAGLAQPMRLAVIASDNSARAKLRGLLDIFRSGQPKVPGV